MKTTYPKVPTVVWILAGAAIYGIAIASWFCAACKTMPFWVNVSFAVFWTTLPPLWFVFEYAIVYPKWGDETSFDEFKHGQQLAAACWAGVLAMLIMIHTALK